MKKGDKRKKEIIAKAKHCKKNGEKRDYLIFSDAALNLIYENQKVIDVEFSEEEKNFSFI